MQGYFNIWRGGDPLIVMKEVDMNKALKHYKYEIDDAAHEIMYNTPGLGGFNLIGGTDNFPMLVEDKGEIYLRSTAVGFEFNDSKERDEILRDLEKAKGKALGYTFDFDSEITDYDDDNIYGYIWCAVMWPIENWFQV